MTDYTPLGGSVIILAGSSSIAISLVPRDDGVREGDEIVEVTESRLTLGGTGLGADAGRQTWTRSTCAGAEFQ